jgi:hypothetical protein
MPQGLAIRSASFLNQADHAAATRTDQPLNFITPCHRLSTGNLAIKATHNARLSACRPHLGFPFDRTCRKKPAVMRAVHTRFPLSLVAAAFRVFK